MALRRVLALSPVVIFLIAYPGQLFGLRGSAAGEWCGSWGILFSALALLVAWGWSGSSRWDLRCGAIALGIHLAVLGGFLVLLFPFDLELELCAWCEPAAEGALRLSAAGLCLCLDACTGGGLAEVVPAILGG